MGDSLKVVTSFPVEVKRVIGFALRQAQFGERHINAKPLGNHIEIVSDFDGTTFRGVYTVRLKGLVVVFQCFQKKSKTGISTPKRDVQLIESRFKEAQKLSGDFKS